MSILEQYPLQSVLLVAWLVSGVITGAMTTVLALKKGFLRRDTIGFPYFVLGFLFSIVGLLFVGLMPEEENQFVAKMRNAMQEAEPTQSNYAPSQRDYHEASEIERPSEQLSRRAGRRASGDKR